MRSEEPSPAVFARRCLIADGIHPSSDAASLPRDRAPGFGSTDSGGNPVAPLGGQGGWMLRCEVLGGGTSRHDT
jgi:hypothetical protein